MMNCSSNGNFQSPIIHNRFSCGLKLSSLGLRYFGAERSFEWKVASQLRLQSRIAVYNREIRAVDPDRGLNPLSPWDEKPFELRPSGRRAYLDEQDVVTLLDPPKELIPLDPAVYNPAAYLWKKIEDIPEERRHRLLNLLKPRLISRLWEITGTRYEDAKLEKKSASKLLSADNSLISPEFWICRSSGGPEPICWTKGFKKVIFCGKDGKTYGRIFVGNMFRWRKSHDYMLTSILKGSQHSWDYSFLMMMIRFERVAVVNFHIFMILHFLESGLICWRSNSSCDYS